METYHKKIADRFIGTPCDLDRDAQWPYECDAKDRYGDSHTITVCRSHLAWWHEPQGGHSHMEERR